MTMSSINSDSILIDAKFDRPLSVANQALQDKIRAGLLGLNVGLSNGLGRANQVLNRTQIGRYYLIGAESGVGKTTIGDLMTLKAIEGAIETNTPLHILYFSFEVSKEMKLATWLCYLVAKYHGIWLSTDYLMGYVKGKVPTAVELAAIADCAIKLEMYLKYVTIFDRELTPTGVLNTVITFFETNPSIGTLHRDKPVAAGKKGYIRGHTRSLLWQRGFIIGIMDHMALGMPEKGQDLKRMMDDMSRKFVITRNLFNMTWIALQQFNMEMAGSSRLSTKANASNAIAPHQLDFGDSRYPFRDAEVVMGLVAPHKYELKEFKGYDMKYFKSFLLVNYIMKNRYGPAGRIFPYMMNPLSRIVTDVPNRAHTPALDALYSEIDKLDNRCQLLFPSDDDLL